MRRTLSKILPLLLFLSTFAWAGAGSTEPGAPTVHDPNSDVGISQSFEAPFVNISSVTLDRFLRGSNIFRTDWSVTAEVPQPFDGLGPLFSRASCTACHLRNGRGRPPDRPTDHIVSMVTHLHVLAQNGPRKLLPHPLYGVQLDYQGIPGIEAEGQALVRYSTRRKVLPDGTVATLRFPEYRFADLRFGELGKEVLISPRLPPPVFGLGLLENVKESTILTMADPDDRDHDGISGRPSWVDAKASKSRRLGRFGWNADRASLTEQVAAALSSDMGITSTLFPDPNCTVVEGACKKATAGAEPEISDSLLRDLVLYVQQLSPPIPRNQDNLTVRRGVMLFRGIGCASCHVLTLRTAFNPKDHNLSNKVIHPFTDLLLHDMGEDLADGLPGHVRSREWRTPPLWGVGLTGAVSTNSYFLHDGRAQTLLEAILWHGGEALRARLRFEHLDSAEGSLGVSSFSLGPANASRREADSRREPLKKGHHE